MYQLRIYSKPTILFAVCFSVSVMPLVPMINISVAGVNLRSLYPWGCSLLAAVWLQTGPLDCQITGNHIWLLWAYHCNLCVLQVSWRRSNRTSPASAMSSWRRSPRPRGNWPASFSSSATSLGRILSCHETETPGQELLLRMHWSRQWSRQWSGTKPCSKPQVPFYTLKLTMWSTAPKKPTSIILVPPWDLQTTLVDSWRRNQRS